MIRSRNESAQERGRTAQGACERRLRQGRRMAAVFALPVVLVAGVFAGTATAQPQTDLLWSYPGVENVVSITAIPDVDGDGGGDVIFESYDSGAPQTDHMFCIRGASSGAGQVIWSARPLGGPSNSGGYGDNCLRLGPDLNGDGFPDVLYGAAWGSRTAFALNGTSGSTLWSFDTYSDNPPYPADSGWVYGVASLGQDLDDDGVSEVLFCTGSYNDGVYCVSGADGTVIWRYQGLDAFFDVMSIDDLNNDGVRDVVAAGGDNDPGVKVLSGAGGGGGGGVVLWSQPSGSVFSVTRLEDITGDGKPEIATTAWDNNIRCYNGANGQLAWIGFVGEYGMRIVTLDDVNGDGVQDLAYASWDNAARVYSGSDGALIWRTAVGTLNGGDVWAIDRVEDVTGDGINDVCCGSFDYNVYLMNGVTGEKVWRYYTGNRLYTVRGVPDLDGNGWPDVVAGTQKLTTGGICYALQGIGPASSVEPDLDADGLRLSPAVPNPFVGLTAWNLRLDQAARVEASVFAPSGRRVAVLASPSWMPAGDHRLVWDGRDESGRSAPAGSYYLRMRIDGRPTDPGKVVLIR